MTFTLDHPHGYYLNGFLRSKARILTKEGKNQTYPLVVEYQLSEDGYWGLGYWDLNGFAYAPGHAGHEKMKLVNYSPPKRKVYMAMCFYPPKLYPTYGLTEKELLLLPTRVSEVIPVEVDV